MPTHYNKYKKYLVMCIRHHDILVLAYMLSFYVLVSFVFVLV